MRACHTRRGRSSSAWDVLVSNVQPVPPRVHAGTALAFVGGERMGAPDAVPVPPIEPGASVDIAVPVSGRSVSGQRTPRPC